MENQVFVSLDLIDPNPYQPRRTDDKAVVAEIAESIQRNGLLQVPSARQLDGRYQLAFGHTRLAAIKLLNTQQADGYSKMPLIVRDLGDLQMFELGVAENIKRRDLNPIEQAEAMRRYMQEFNKTSAEAGEFFNCSEEYVRSVTRFNELLPEAKEKFAAGKINVTTARTMLSMQKVASREVILETLDRLEKGEDRWGNLEKPEDVIRETLDELDTLKELWSGNDKPRGGHHDAWLLDMKKFPNQFLPILTAVDIAMALGIQDNQKALKLVDEYLQYMEAQAVAFNADEAPGESDDMARWKTEARKRLDALAKLDPDYMARIQHLIAPPACSACPFHSVVQGTHYCGMETCFTRKTRAWEYEKLRMASEKLKIAIYNKDADGEYRVLEESYTDNGQKHKDLFRKRVKDLRLALAVDIDRKKPQSGYEGVPNSAVVMLVGKTLKTLLETSHEKRVEKRTKQQAEELLNRLRTDKCEELDVEVSRHTKMIFDGMNLAALQALMSAPSTYSGWSTTIHTMPGVTKPDKNDVLAQEDFYRIVFAFNMVRKIGGHYKKTISEYAASLNEVVKMWGVKLPKSITKLAAQMDAEIKAATTEAEEK